MGELMFLPGEWFQNKSIVHPSVDGIIQHSENADKHTLTNHCMSNLMCHFHWCGVMSKYIMSITHTSALFDYLYAWGFARSKSVASAPSIAQSLHLSKTASCFWLSDLLLILNHPDIVLG